VNPAPGHATPDDEDVDGLAGERTDLAWSRSGLAVLAATAAILKLVVRDRPGGVGAAAVYLSLFLGALAWGAVMLHAQFVARSAIEGRRVSSRRRFELITVGTASFGAAAIVLAVMHAR
jgi:uncharacterized membrane protein YidH (DUF202 family)